MMRAPSLLILVAVASGCQRSASSEGGAPAPSAAPSTAAPVASSFESASHSVQLEAAGPYKKDRASSFKVIVHAKGEFHVNDEYPARFSASSAPGIAYAASKLARASQPDAFVAKPCASGKDTCVLEVSVSFTPEQSGMAELGGELSFGLCRQDNCTVEKRALRRAVSVE
jgi:hypothetical protein